MPYSLPLPPVPDDLKYVAYLRADFDACPRNLSLNVGKEIARLILLIDGKGSFVSAPHRDLQQLLREDCRGKSGSHWHPKGL
jgi:hypothetical protein